MNLKLTEEQQLQNSNTQMHQKCGFLFSENSQKKKKKREMLLNQFMDVKEVKISKIVVRSFDV